MTANKRYPVIILDRIAVKNTYTTQGKVSLNCNSGVNLKVSLENNQLSNDQLEAHSIKNEPGISELDENSSDKIYPLINLVAEVKEEFCTKSEITHELVAFLDRNSVVETIKSENSSQNNDASYSGDGLENYYDRCTPSILVGDQSVNNITFQHSTGSNVQYVGVELANVSVNPVDLFSSNDWRPSASMNLIAKVKEENDVKSEITCELVTFSGLSSVDETLKSENSLQNNDGSYSVDGLKNDGNRPAPSISVGNWLINRKSSQNSGKSEVQNDGIKLKDVTLKLVDLFSNNDWRLGKCHLNDGVCLCTYCHGEGRNVCNVEGISRNFRSGKELTVPQSGKKLQSISKLDEQPRVKKGKTKVLQCEKCSQKRKSRSRLEHHMRVHNDERPFKCDLCTKAFKQPEILKRHKICVHCNERPFKCDVCSASFKQKNVLKQYKIVHSSERPFKCSVCSATFKRKRFLRKHMAAHDDKRPFKCDVCFMAFKKKGSLKLHVGVHIVERPFKCDLCSVTFKWKHCMKSHIKSVHCS